MGDLNLELESALPPPGAQSEAGIRRQRRTGGRRVVLGLFGLLGLVLLLRGTSVGRLATSLLPSTTCRQARAAHFSRRGQIDWFPCPDSAETYCAFFEVPLEHREPRHDETVSLALRMFPSTAKKQEYKGTLIVNPGGPGGSGTEEVARLGPHLSTIVQGRYDILSFDPRGVNLTSPALSCFRTESLAQLFQRDVESLGTLYESQSPFLPTPAPGDPMTEGELRWAGKLDGMNVALDRTCVESGDQGMLKGSTTASTARDVKAIVEALGEEELQYWGFSYGTILGATFAAMFPEKVGRMVLDGVSDADLYHNNLWDWGRSAMNHTHLTLDGFLTSCLLAGPLCALSTPNSTLHTLHTRLASLRTSLRLSPLPVHSPTLGAGILTTSAVQNTIFRGLYNPKGWPELAEELAEVERGEGRRMWEKLAAGDLGLGSKDPTENVFNRSMDVTGSGLLCHSIMCSDTDHSALEDTSLEKLVRYMREMGEISISGQAWAEWVSQCRRWSNEGVETYRGPWTLEGGMGRPKNPVLFVAMTADPVTPLSAAIKMASGFESSASLLIQNGMGHCSLAHPSLCTVKKIRDYFLDGDLPARGTECESDPGFLFPDPGAVRMKGREEDEEMREALEALAGEGVGRW